MKRLDRQNNVSAKGLPEENTGKFLFFANKFESNIQKNSNYELKTIHNYKGFTLLQVYLLANSNKYYFGIPDNEITDLYHNIEVTAATNLDDYLNKKLSKYCLYISKEDRFLPENIYAIICFFEKDYVPMIESRLSGEPNEQKAVILEERNGFCLVSIVIPDDKIKRYIVVSQTQALEIISNKKLLSVKDFIKENSMGIAVLNECDASRKDPVDQELKFIKSRFASYVFRINNKKISPPCINVIIL